MAANTSDATPGRCTNFGTCQIARDRQVVAVKLGSAFTCPECARMLVPPDVLAPVPVARRSAGLVIGALGSAALAASVTAFFVLRPAAEVPSTALPPVRALAISAVPPAPFSQTLGPQASVTPPALDAAHQAALAQAAAGADAAMAAQRKTEQVAATAEQARLAAASAALQAQVGATVKAQEAARAQATAQAQAGAERLAKDKQAAAKAAKLAAFAKVDRAAAVKPTPAPQVAATTAPPAPPAPTERLTQVLRGNDHPFVAHAAAGGGPSYPVEYADSPRPGRVTVRFMIEASGVPSGCGVVAAEGGGRFRKPCCAGCAAGGCITRQRYVVGRRWPKNTNAWSISGPPMWLLRNNRCRQSNACGACQMSALIRGTLGIAGRVSVLGAT